MVGGCNPDITAKIFIENDMIPSVFPQDSEATYYAGWMKATYVIIAAAAGEYGTSGI
jgi:hypothetical protein